MAINPSTCEQCIMGYKDCLRYHLSAHMKFSLAGLDKMYSLTDLNLSENYFTDVGTVLTLGELPCLEILDFRDNAMTREPLYRVRVFTAFDDRAEQVDKSFNNLR